jgi:hypothetical protein
MLLRTMNNKAPVFCPSDEAKEEAALLFYQIGFWVWLVTGS